MLCHYYKINFINNHHHSGRKKILETPNLTIKICCVTRISYTKASFCRQLAREAEKCVILVL